MHVLIRRDVLTSSILPSFVRTMLNSSFTFTRWSRHLQNKYQHPMSGITRFDRNCWLYYLAHCSRIMVQNNCIVVPWTSSVATKSMWKSYSKSNTQPYPCLSSLSQQGRNVMQTFFIRWAPILQQTNKLGLWKKNTAILRWNLNFRPRW